MLKLSKDTKIEDFSGRKFQQIWGEDRVVDFEIVSLEDGKIEYLRSCDGKRPVRISGECTVSETKIEIHYEKRGRYYGESIYFSHEI